MKVYEVVFNRRDGVVQRHVVEAANGREAKRAVYAKLGVKRLVGVVTREVK